jgi:hypothetical protein
MLRRGNLLRLLVFWDSMLADDQAQSGARPTLLDCVNGLFDRPGRSAARFCHYAFFYNY